MTQPDEDLQNKIERGIDADDSLNAKAYQKVFEVLSKDPFTVSPDFADEVISRIEAKGSLSKDYFWFGIGLISFIIAAIAAVALSDLKLDFEAFKFVSGYSNLFLFGITFLVLIQYLDKQLIRRRLSA